MNRTTIPLGRILGIPLGLDPSWFLVFILVTWSLAVSYFPGEFGNWSGLEYWVVAAVTAVLFFASVALHELGHSLIAIRHRVPVRSITLYVFGGVAALGSEPPSAVAEFWIAIAGPAVSFTLAGLFALLQLVLGKVASILAVSRYLAYINVSLGLFNLIPGFPLDGGRVFRAIVWGATGNLRRATLVAMALGRLVAWGFILFGVWQVLSGRLGNGLWIAFIGWFLNNAATSQLQQQTLHDLLGGHKVYEVMNRSYASVPAEMMLRQLVDEQILGTGRRCFMVVKDGHEAGLLTVHHLKEIPREQWATTTAAQAMISVAEMKWIGPGRTLWSALEEMDSDGVNQLPVMAEERCLGMLSRDDIISFLRRRREPGV